MRAYRLCDAFSRSSRPPTRLRLYLVTAAFFTAFCAHRAASRAGEPKPAAPQESTRTVAVSAPTRSWRGNGGAPPQEWIERLIHSRNSGRASSEMPGARFRNFAPRDRRFLNDEQTHARSNGFFFLLAGTAFVVMFMTIESMGRGGSTTSALGSKGRRSAACQSCRSCPQVPKRFARFVLMPASPRRDSPSILLSSSGQEPRRKAAALIRLQSQRRPEQSE